MRIGYIHASTLNPNVDAFITKNGRFTHVGSSAHILNQPLDRVVDLQHKTVLPGFHDSHLHLLGIGFMQSMFDVREYQSIEALIKAGKLRQENPLVGRGFHEQQFAEKRAINKNDLNQISTTKPVIIYRVCGHMVVTNQWVIDQAIAQFKITHQPDKGYDLNQGIFKEDAIETLLKTLPKKTQHAIEQDILTVQNHLLSHGITSVGSDDFAIYPIDYNTVLNGFKNLVQNSQLKLRVLEQVNMPSIARFKQFLKEQTPNQRYGNYRLGPLKLLADGSLGAKTAYLSEPYADQPDQYGMRVFDEKTLIEYFKLCKIHHMDVAIHAIGDACIDDILNAIETVFDAHDRKVFRHSIIHAQLARPDQIQRMKALNVGAQTQPIFINSDHAIIKQSLGELRYHETYLFDQMRREGVTTSISTDAPIEDVNPFENLYLAVTRQSLKNPELGVFNATEKFPPLNAIEAYTRTPAYWMYLEQELGEIKPGYLADFIVVEGFNLYHPKSYLTTIVKETYIEGERVYLRP